MPSAITSLTRPSGRPSLNTLASVRRCGYSMLIAGSSGQLAANGRAVSVHARCAANSRPCASIETAPAPKLSFTNTYSLPLGSSLRIVSVCSCANSTPPSGVPTMPSAVSKSAQISSHFASAATTPGIAVTEVARSPGSNRDSWACATAQAKMQATATVVVLINEHSSENVSGDDSASSDRHRSHRGPRSPWIFSGSTTMANSCALRAASSSSLRFSSR